MRGDGTAWRAELPLDAAAFTANYVTLRYPREDEPCSLSTPVQIHAPASKP